MKRQKMEMDIINPLCAGIDSHGIYRRLLAKFVRGTYQTWF